MSDRKSTCQRWICDVAKDDRACDVAVRTIRQRLREVEYYLPLAANHADDDIEYVHQLRVATRRAVAAVELYKEFLPKKPRKALCRELKQIRRAAGTARDCDVLIQRQADQADSRSAERFLKDVRKKRRDAQSPLEEAFCVAVEQKTLLRLADQALVCVSCGEDSTRSASFLRWARRRLRQRVRAFFEAEPHQLDDLDSLHRFRIRGKDLRYAIELLAAAFPDSLRTESYPLVEHLQERLGTVNDHAVAIDRFRKWRADSKKANRRKHLRKLIKREREQLAEALWQFARWWTPRRSKQVQQRFRCYVRRK